MLTNAAEEADRLKDRHIGCEHLLLGLMREEDHPAAQILSKHGATLSELRLQIDKLPRMDAPLKIYKRFPPKRFPRFAGETVELHGARWSLEYVHERVSHLTQYAWYWRKLAWRARDIVLERGRGSMSFDLNLAADTAKSRTTQRGMEKRPLCYLPLGTF